MTWQQAASVADLADGIPLACTVADICVVIVRLDDEIVALHDECPHAGVRLSFGDVDDGRIECIGHGAWFDVKTGACLGPLMTGEVTVLPVEIRGDQIWVDPTPASAPDDVIGRRRRRP